ncbi:MAG: DegT/DnrJ/EryC1/StrS family aminotransferase [Desulfobacter sp.]|nr:MAG: DegT/DnrJ/EryC1/StrS family aminotransferase [Desulfobacter sp.]
MNPPISFVDLKAQNNLIGDKIKQAMDDVVTHGKFIMGPEVLLLEEKLSLFTKAKYVISCSSGTDALLMALMSIGIKPGDHVLTTPFTFIATAEVICMLGAIPVFVDIDKKTFNISPEKLEQTLDRCQGHPKHSFNPRCIIPVDIFGLLADYEAINKIAKQHGLVVIEDAAQSLGASFKDKMVGSLSKIAGTSFFPAKPLGCYGDGGAVFTNDKALAQTLLSIRVHGKGQNKYDNIRVGINARMDTLQAAVLLEKLKIFESELGRRRKIASIYQKLLKDEIRIQKFQDPGQSAWAQFSIVSERRAAIAQALDKNAIPWAIYYPKPLHLQTAFSRLGYKPGDFPVSEYLCKNILSIPVHPYMTDDQVQFIADTINKAF